MEKKKKIKFSDVKEEFHGCQIFPIFNIYIKYHRSLLGRSVLKLYMIRLRISVKQFGGESLKFAHCKERKNPIATYQ